MEVTIGKNTIGDNNKMKVDLKTYNRSTSNKSRTFTNTQSVGTLVPFMREYCQTGDTWEIELHADVKTHPTVGPLFGSFKFQNDLFLCPIRLYHSWLHNNKLDIGNDMASVKLPLLEVEIDDTDVPKSGSWSKDNPYPQINPSSILWYLGKKGWGRKTKPGIVNARSNALKLLSYYDIFKNYYANVQQTETPEEKPAEEETPVAEGIKKKVKTLNEIVKEVNVKSGKVKIQEAEIGSVLTKTYGDNIPKPNFTPTLGENFRLSGNDAEVFSDLFEKAPSKGGEDTQTKGSGNGEVSVYWLFSQSGHNVIDERGSDKPDLKIDGVGVEIKAYDSAVITLGKFAKDKESLRLLNIVFGFKALVSTLEGNKKEANPANFTDKDLVQAFDLMFEFSKNEELKNMAEKNGFSIITELYNKINSVKTALNIQSDDSKAAAAAILRQLAINKLGRKPGIPGYILNVKKTGEGEFHKITKEAIGKVSDPTILDSIKINQAQIDMNFRKIFG